MNLKNNKTGRKQKRILVIFIVLLLGFVSFALLKRGLVNSYLKSFIIKTASFELGSEIKIIDLDIKILKPSIHARGIRINNIGGSNAILLARDVKISFSPFPIFLRRVIIPKIELTDVALSGSKKDIEKLKLPVIEKKSPGKPSILKFEIGEAVADNFEVNILQDKKTNLYLNIKKINARSHSNGASVSFSGSGEILYKNEPHIIKTASGQVNLSDKKVNIGMFFLDLDMGISLRLKGPVFPEMKMDCLADINLEKLKFKNFKSRQMKGKLQIPFKASGKLNDPAVKGRINSTIINVANVSLNNIDMNFKGNLNEFVVSKGSVDFYDSTVSFSGRSDVSSQLVSSYKLRIKDFKLKALDKLIAGSFRLPNGNFNGEMHLNISDISKNRFSAIIKGSGNSIKGRYSIAHAEGPSVDYVINETLDIGGRFESHDKNNIEVKTLFIEGKTLAISAKGNISSEDSFIKYSLSSPNIGFLSIDEYYPKGPLKIDGLIKIVKGQPTGVGSMISENLSINSHDLGSIKGSFVYSGNDIRIERFNLEKNNLGFEFSTALNLKNEYLKSFKANFKGYELGNLLKIYSKGKGHLANVEGSFLGDINLSGPFNKLSGQISLISRELNFYTRPAGKFVLKADLNKGRISLNDFSFVFKDELILSGRGHYDMAGDALLSFSGRNLNIDLFNFLGIKKYFGESKVDFNVDFFKKGIAESLTGSVLLTADREDIERYRIMDLVFNSDFNKLNLKGKYDEGKVVFDAVYPLKGENSFKINLSSEDFDFAPLLARKITLNYEKVSSKINMSVQLGGILADTLTWKGQVNVSNFQIAKEGISLSNDIPIRIQIDKGGYDISGFRLIGPQSDFALKGSGEIGGLNDLSLEGFIDFNILSIFFKEFHRAEGRVDVKASIEGEFSDISIVGSGKLSNGVLLVRDFPNVIDNLKSDITFSHKKFIFDNVKGEVGGGTINAQGLLEIGDLDGGLYFDCIANIDRVTTVFPADYPGEVSGTLTFRGPYFVPTLGGELKVHSMRYTKPWNWRSKMIKFTEKTYSLGIKSDPNVFLNIRVNIPKEVLELKNNVADARLSGNLNILGNDHNIGLIGTINVDRGNVYFLDNEFELTGGTVKFTEENSVLALFDVEGQTVVKDTEIFLNLRGTTENPEMILSSRPAKSETDIVSLLTLGVESAELTAGGTQSDLSQNLVTSILTGTIQDNIEKTFRKTRIIDTFQVYPSFSEETRTTELRVGIGKKLPYKMELLYSTDVNNIGRNQEVKLNKGITDNLSLQGILKEKSNQRVDLGMDFELKFDF